MDDVARRIGEIRAREEAATPGPWRLSGAWGWIMAGEANTPEEAEKLTVGQCFDAYENDYPNADNNQTFIAHIRQDARWLLGVAEAAHAFCKAPTGQRSDAERGLYLALRMTPPAPRAGEGGGGR